MSKFWKWLLELFTGGGSTPPAPPDPPTPDPDPPLPPPGPPGPGPICNRAPDFLKRGCWNKPPDGEWAWIPEAPPPPPTPPEPGILEGTPECGIYWYQKQRIADATPKIRNAARCNMVGYTGRMSCPVVPDNHPDRGRLEHELIGGDYPVWELAVTSGDLRIANPGEWMCVVAGHGVGRLRWSYPNGRATSRWLEVNR